MQFESFFSVDYDARGGRRTQHLGELVPVANTYANVIIIVGNNDVGTLTDWQIIQNLRNFLENLRSEITVILCGFLPRLDHELEYNYRSNCWENPVTRLNLQLQAVFPKQYKSPRDFSRNDFMLHDPAHFNFFGRQRLCRFLYRQYSYLMD